MEGFWQVLLLLFLLRVLGFGLRGLGFGVRISASGAPDSGFRVPGFGLRVSGSGIQAIFKEADGREMEGFWQVLLLLLLRTCAAVPRRARI